MPGLAALVVLGSSLAAQDIGFEGPRFSGAGATPTESKPQSKLWFNDGHWWGSLWSVSARAFRIHRLDFGNHTWVDSGVLVDPRSDSHSDALWDGRKLYIVTHLFSATGGASGHPIAVLRYGYNPASDTYSMDQDFPVFIGNVSTEAVVIDKDSTGTVWAAWTQDLRVRISHTQGSDTSWKPAFVLPSNTTAIDADDLCSVIHFNGDRIGVAWSDQVVNAFRFSVHLDGAPDTAWSAPESLPSSADDHINLAADSAGRVFLAGKTAADELVLLVRGAAGWQRFVAWQPVPIHTRPIVLLNEQARTIHMFATDQDMGGEVSEKVSSLDTISFPGGTGRIVMRDASGPRISNPTSTKQNFTASTGLVVLAHHDTTGFYWHHDVAPGGTGVPVADFTASPRNGQAPLTVNFRDASTGSISSRLWSFGDGGTSTAIHPTHTYGAGTFTVSLTVTGPGGTDTETKRDFIVVTAPPGAPVADFTGSPRSGQAPLTVRFTDRSTGSITAWRWSFGDGGTSSARNPSHTYGPGTYTVSLAVTGPGGTDTETKRDFITVSQPPSNFVLLRPLPGLAGVPNLLTVIGATPGAVVSFYSSKTQGSSTVFSSTCPNGVPLGLRNPSLMGTASANFLGVAIFSFFVPITSIGDVSHFQAVDQATCRASNAVTEQF